MNQRRYLAELGGALAAYMAVLLGSLAILGTATLDAPARTILALSPMLPAAGMCWAILRQLHRMDELQRRVQLEAFGLAFAGTALVTFSYGFLEGIGYPRMSMFVVWPLMATLWVIGLFASRRRYR